MTTSADGLCCRPQSGCSWLLQGSSSVFSCLVFLRFCGTTGVAGACGTFAAGAAGCRLAISLSSSARNCSRFDGAFACPCAAVAGPVGMKSTRAPPPAMQSTSQSGTLTPRRSWYSFELPIACVSCAATACADSPARGLKQPLCALREAALRRERYRRAATQGQHGGKKLAQP